MLARLAGLRHVDRPPLVVGLPAARFDVTFNAREGRRTSADFLGNKLATQEIFGDRNTFSSG
jgi:hypothetical protein